MAFVRWRGNCAQLLATIYQNGKSQQILLANLQQNYASADVREKVAREHPGIHVDWLAVERALARGPKTRPAAEPPMTILQAENLLRTIAQEFKDVLFPRQALDLRGAADTLSSLRDDPRLLALYRRCATNAPSHQTSAETLNNAEVSSDDSARPPPPEGAQLRPFHRDPI